MPFPNLDIPPLFHHLLSWAPIILVAVRWVIFLMLDSALAQFYEHGDGTRIRLQLAKMSSDYVRSIAPGTPPDPVMWSSRIG